MSAQDGSLDSGFMPRGATWSFTPTAAGTFPYYCLFHPGMQATLVVSNAAAAPAGTPTALPTDTPVPTDTPLLTDTSLLTDTPSRPRPRRPRRPRPGAS